MRQGQPLLAAGHRRRVIAYSSPFICIRGDGPTIHAIHLTMVVSVPRVCGNEPYALVATDRAERCSPRVCGWAWLILAYPRTRSVFPVCAGMSPGFSCLLPLIPYGPRASGDEPPSHDPQYPAAPWFPREWG